MTNFVLRRDRGGHKNICHLTQTCAGSNLGQPKKNRIQIPNLYLLTPSLGLCLLFKNCNDAKKTSEAQLIQGKKGHKNYSF